jgi:hypothetical protein
MGQLSYRAIVEDEPPGAAEYGKMKASKVVFRLRSTMAKVSRNGSSVSLPMSPSGPPSYPIRMRSKISGHA